MREWLDTETKALLCADPPEKSTAIAAEGYSLLLVRRGLDEQRLEDVVGMIQKENPVVLVEYPFVVAQEMTLEEALAGQFALACCDCISAFVSDEVVCNCDPNYLQELNRQVMQSPEFKFINVTILHIPHTEESHRFCWQFLGLAAGVPAPTTRLVFRKKARLMEHWAKRSGVELKVSERD